MKIYVMESAGGMCKVGKAKNPEERLEALKTGHPFALTIAGAFEVDASMAYAIERKSHLLLRDHQMTGEWFRVTVEQAKEKIREAIGDSAFPFDLHGAREREKTRLQQYRKRRMDKINALPAMKAALEKIGHALSSIRVAVADTDEDWATKVRTIAEEALS